MILSNIYDGTFFAKVVAKSHWCPLKGHTYLNKPAAESKYVFKYV